MRLVKKSFQPVVEKVVEKWWKSGGKLFGLKKLPPSKQLSSRFLQKLTSATNRSGRIIATREKVFNHFSTRFSTTPRLAKKADRVAIFIFWRGEFSTTFAFTYYYLNIKISLLRD